MHLSMGFIRRIGIIVDHITILLSKTHFSLGSRISLAVTYCSIVFRRFFTGRVPGIKKKNIWKVLGMTIELDHYRSDFYWIFTEIFIDENYYFKTLNKDPFIVDCGGNIGISVIYFKLIYPQAKLLVFEPSPDNISLFKKNIERNNLKDVELIPVAVGKEKGEITIYTQGPGTTMYTEFAQKQKKQTEDHWADKVTVPLHNVSEYITEHVDYLKLDVEGAEADILEALDRDRKIHFVQATGMEYHQFSGEINKLSTIVKIFEDNGYRYLCGGEAKNVTFAPREHDNFFVFAEKK